MLKKIQKSIKTSSKNVSVFVDRKPFVSFFIALGTLLALIVLSNILGAPKQAEKEEAPLAKQVEIYNIGKAPRLTVQAQIEKSGIVHITALAPGIVQSISRQAGEQVIKGETLLGLSSNYQGGNSFSLARQLAQIQYQNITDTYDAQKNLIKNQREIAEKSHVLAEDLRGITNQSLGETQNLINLNGEILTSLDQNLAELEATNIGGANDDLILSTKQLKVQFLSANNQAKQALRQAEYNASSDNAPTELSDLQKKIAVKQLDIQEKMLDLGREVSRIQLQITQVTEAMMFPAAPFSGTIQRVFVNIGQQVNPGTELMIISEVTDTDPVIAIAYVSSDVAKKVSRLEPSVLHINTGTKFSTYPSFITQEAIQGSLYGVYFNLPDQYKTDVSQKGFITVDLPIGYFDTASVIPYIPVDAVYQTKEQNYVFLAKKSKAEAQSIELGEVFGSYVEIRSGLKDEDKVILDRNVIAGDRVVAR